MIQFKSCSWKNFLSTGNDSIKVLLDKSPTTLIVGQNGSGKSTLLDALSFGLVGAKKRVGGGLLRGRLFRRFTVMLLCLLV